MDMYIIKESTKEESDLIWQGIIEYNSSKLSLKGDVPFVPVNRVMKDSAGNIIGGINCELNYVWNTMYIDMLWVKEEYRKNGHASRLLKEIELIGKEEGCTLVHLETMDFQAKDFYMKNEYQIFGELDNVPEGHKRYYLKKIL
ncbi:GNAT family N-acetyltransferase [Oceanirhabdus seepicola]|uniref:GNAT family N-acetyltransferase n=1 Tax=Oceanirhabdus seepicola TaxID=2828781 RepID=A0A9J6NWS9_9CLOT|nr:GNAT family N-acetyltransferase [Oceanirhabdus seepicola]MCM1988975.1 GNAT family N-acetyltransferase [Oceanirhabdus seepicola]